MKCDRTAFPLETRESQPACPRRQWSERPIERPLSRIVKQTGIGCGRPTGHVLLEELIEVRNNRRRFTHMLNAKTSATKEEVLVAQEALLTSGVQRHCRIG